MDDVSLSEAEYALILRGHAWIRSVDRYASVSRGWSGILVDLLHVLDVVMEGIASAHPRAHAVHFTTKSKLGSLRVHFGLAGISGPHDAAWSLMREVIDRAERRSTRTCERCGAPGRLRDVDDWLMTLCDAHAIGHEGAR